MMTHIDPAALDFVIDSIDFDEHQGHHSGKVRESFIMNDQARAIVVTDRISAFDFILGTVPFKGQVLNQIAAWWFGKLDDIGVPHHLIAVPHPNVSVVKNAKPLPIEIIVRGYLTGTTTTSAWYAYKNNNRMISGIEMPEGMVKNQIFPKPILTPTTKPEIGHDRNISRKEIIQEGLVSEEIYAQAESYALKMFAHGQALAAAQGLILVDTKYEMGLTLEGDLIVIDEVHTPDSSRYWIADTYLDLFEAGKEPVSLDKEFVRRMLVGAGYDVDNNDQNPKDFMTNEIRLQAAEKYLELYQIMTGQTLDIQITDFEAGIQAALKEI